jgi:hypothetical protein
MTLNDSGPDIQSDDGPLWRSRRDHQPNEHETSVAHDIPLESQMAAAADEVTHFVSVATSTTRERTSEQRLATSDRAREKRDNSNFTKRIILVFDALERDIDAFLTQLRTLTNIPSRKEVHDMQLKISNFQACLDRHTRHSETLDKKRSTIITKLASACDQLQEIRVLLPESDNPVEYPIGVYLI